MGFRGIPCYRALLGRKHPGQVQGMMPLREHATYAEQFRREIEVQSKIRNSADALEGRAAFVEKRPVRFTGL